MDAEKLKQFDDESRRLMNLANLLLDDTCIVHEGTRFCPKQAIRGLAVTVQELVAQLRVRDTADSASKKVK